MSKSVKIGEIASLKTGPFGTQFSAKEYTNSGVPVINVKNIGYGQIIEDELEFVSELTKERLSEHVLKTGDIVFGRKGSVDRHAFIGEKYDGWVQGSDCIRLRFQNGINPRYVSHFLKLGHIKKQINHASVGSTMASLNTDILKDIFIMLPDIGTQNDIERILSALESKIELNTAICTELESMAKTLYDYWFMQFDFPDENGKPYRSSGGEMVWNDQLKREIPKGWAVTTMSALTTVLTGKEDANFSTPNGNYKFFTCAQETIFCDTPAFSGHAVLIAGNGDFNVKHYTGSFNAYQRTYVLIPKESKYYAIMYIVAQQQIQAFKQGSNGSIVKFITKGDVENIPIILPDNDVCLDALNRIFDKIEHCEREKDELTKLRDWLLPMLMNGQAAVE